MQKIFNLKKFSNSTDIHAKLLKLYQVIHICIVFTIVQYRRYTCVYYFQKTFWKKSSKNQSWQKNTSLDHERRFLFFELISFVMNNPRVNLHHEFEFLAHWLYSYFCPFLFTILNQLRNRSRSAFHDRFFPIIENIFNCT